ncbi:RnfABCDGE type electron transport complex subunit B [Algiphilus sp. W345]|uniref:RnfABCDGE type electron transport complex subunit B n=1 Tax=Banduia mediterranea TaxID=3075609 RepID=A0ABU2WH16_9GAMM|nr:RnfABCDGE type electron transport complex subunit B [Algiphilus sp. W345]MDT0496561.1 RnfABCDGE type electron transport complex subunit B [Algiphilus sp. W345]
MSLADSIDARLPQTQCTRCGYDGCRPYAEAIASGEARINQCPPGGGETIAELAAITGQPALPLDPAYGEPETQPFVALIDEARCIGCYKCIQVCPVDAIVGAPKLMHTVVEAECTGCELCLPPCPVDCIEWVPRQIDPYLGRERATRSRQRFELRTARLQGQSDERESKRRARTSPLRDAATMDDLLARVRARAGKP